MTLPPSSHVYVPVQCRTRPAGRAGGSHGGVLEGHNIVQLHSVKLLLAISQSLPAARIESAPAVFVG